MMTVRTIGMLSAWAGMSMLGGCASTGTAEPGRETCHPTSAAALVGKIAPDDAIIMHSTGSAIVRRIAPGNATTKDFRKERVTVTVAEGRVIAASCG